MKYMVVLLNPQGHTINDGAREPYEALPRARGLAFQWHRFGPIAVLLCAGGTGRDPVLMTTEEGVAVGIVRLDNRADLQRCLGDDDGRSLSDLALVGRLVLRGGAGRVRDILGDFAFLTWNPVTGTAIGACDALGVTRLYHGRRGPLVVFASRAEALALGESYDLQYLAQRVAGCQTSPTLTPYEGVSAVPVGATVMVTGATIRTQQYWSPYEFASEPALATPEPEAAEMCRALLAESVRVRLAGTPNAWAQLSGGMDSSSVVSMAQWLTSRGVVDHGLAGTITYVDPHALGGDERHYANAVIERWPVRNEVIVESPTWGDYNPGILKTDEPFPSLEACLRDYRVCELMFRSGSSVLLTGAGGDVLFGGTMFFFADWIAEGRVWAALREITRRAALGRASAWQLGYHNALLPLLPDILRRYLLDRVTMPPWLSRAAVDRYGLGERTAEALFYKGRRGRKYRDAVAASVAMVPTGLTVGVLEEQLDVRHPYYYRPLVEFALRLPPDLCVRPYARKWVLREAMSGILPDLVKARVGKGTYNGAASWSLATQQQALQPILQHSILAELGIMDAKKLQSAFVEAQHEHEGEQAVSGSVYYTVALEAWLQARSGRWSCGDHSADAVLMQSHTPSAEGITTRTL
jgi:asparagine synthase (glutamine-hydrolysing)